MPLHPGLLVVVTHVCMPPACRPYTHILRWWQQLERANDTATWYLFSCFTKHAPASTPGTVAESDTLLEKGDVEIDAERHLLETSATKPTKIRCGIQSEMKINAG